MNHAATRAVGITLWACGVCAAHLPGQDRGPLKGPAKTVNLIARMPSSAQISFRALPAESLWLEQEQNADLVVIAGRWLLGRGESLDARCALIGGDEKTEGLVSLKPDAASLFLTSFRQTSTARTIPLVTASDSTTGQQSALQMLLVVHSPVRDPSAFLRVMVTAY
jgi:hypothetical protein